MIFIWSEKCVFIGNMVFLDLADILTCTVVLSSVYTFVVASYLSRVSFPLVVVWDFTFLKDILHLRGVLFCWSWTGFTFEIPFQSFIDRHSGLCHYVLYL